MVQHVINKLSQQVTQIIINANQNITVYETFSYPVVCDLEQHFAGPLAGLEAGLSVCSTPYLVSAPCDSPLLPTDLVSRLASALVHENADVAVACTKESTEVSGETVVFTQKHPVFLLVKSALRDSLSGFLKQGGRKVEDWLNTLVTTEVLFDDNAAFQNINTPEQLQSLALQSRTIRQG